MNRHPFQGPAQDRRAAGRCPTRHGPTTPSRAYPANKAQFFEIRVRKRPRPQTTGRSPKSRVLRERAVLCGRMASPDSADTTTLSSVRDTSTRTPRREANALPPSPSSRNSPPTTHHGTDRPNPAPRSVALRPGDQPQRPSPRSIESLELSRFGRHLSAFGLPIAVSQ